MTKFYQALHINQKET